MSEAVEAYAVTRAAGDVLSIQGFTTEQLRTSLGGQLARKLVLDDGRLLSLDSDAGLAPVNGIGIFGSISTRLDLTLPGGPKLGTKAVVNFDNTGSASMGLRASIMGQL